jgi:hypothetical protein
MGKIGPWKNTILIYQIKWKRRIEAVFKKTIAFPNQLMRTAKGAILANSADAAAPDPGAEMQVNYEIQGHSHQYVIRVDNWETVPDSAQISKCGLPGSLHRLRNHRGRLPDLSQLVAPDGMTAGV